MTQPTARKPASWPKQNAIAITSEPGLVAVIRTLISSPSWSVMGPVPTAVGAAFAVKEGRASIIVADDTSSQPVSGIIRYLLTHPITVCTPILALVGPSFETDAEAMKRLGRIQIAQKPVSISRSKILVDRLMMDWESQELIGLRQAGYCLQKGDQAGGILRLKHLATSQTAGPLATQALALILRQMGKLKEAESLLLAWLKKDPRNLVIVCGLVDLYMSAAMPQLALKLLKAVNEQIKPSLLFYPDTVQTACLIGDFKEAINFLHVLIKAEFNLMENLLFLCRLLFAVGREKEAQYLLNQNKDLFLKLQKAWEIADLIPAAATGS